MNLNPLAILLPKGRGKAGGTAATPTYNPQQVVLTVPQYREHLTDVFNSRSANDSRRLISDLARQDSDVSGAFFAYQSIAGSAAWKVRAYDLQGQLAADGIQLAHTIIERLTTVSDYTVGFSAKSSLKQLNDDMRYWTLLRGAPAAELVLDKRFEPDNLRLVDLGSVEWSEKAPGVYKPLQKPAGSNLEINLDVPTFFTARFHQNPMDIYTYSPFVAAINTVAARQEIINELYRITKVVGYPRMDITVLEEVLMKSAPPLIRADPKTAREFVSQQVQQITASYMNLTSDQPLIHTDAVKAEMLNDSRPATSLPIQNVINILTEMNMAALKTMPAVVGKSNGNGQVASTEARLFALNCDALNKTVADIWSQALTLACRLAGFQGRIEFVFQPVELRPTLELEPQLTMRQSRYEQALSRGYITDEEFHLEVYHRPKPDSAPELSGTNFLEPTKPATVDAEGISPNGDPLGRGLAPEGGTKVARSKAVK